MGERLMLRRKAVVQKQSPRLSVPLKRPHHSLLDASSVVEGDPEEVEVEEWTSNAVVVERKLEVTGEEAELRTVMHCLQAEGEEVVAEVVLNMAMYYSEVEEAVEVPMQGSMSGAEGVEGAPEELD